MKGKSSSLKKKENDYFYEFPLALAEFNYAQLAFVSCRQV